MTSKSENISDQIADIGQQINTTLNQFQEKFQDMSETVGSSLPDVMAMTQKALYSSCYYLAFGSVYAVMFTANCLMGVDPVGSGLREGAAAAKDAVHSKDKNVSSKPRSSAPKVNTAAPKRKATPPKEEAPVKEGPVKKISQSKKAPKVITEEKLVKETKRGDMSKAVKALIQDSPEGITTTELKEKTGLTEWQIWNIIKKAKKAGKIKQAKRGVYLRA
ncbi:MAG: hypothetical protein WCH07_09145 [Deltaproteobacteria bacterium]